MYDKVKYMGKTLKEWQKLTANQYSFGELYRMMLEKVDFYSIAKSAVE